MRQDAYSGYVPQVDPSIPAEPRAQASRSYAEQVGELDHSQQAQFSALLHARRASRLFNYSVPAWSVFYTFLLVLIDAFITMLAAGIIFLIHPVTYVFLRKTIALPDPIVAFLVLISLSWIASLGVTNIYSRHNMGAGYDVYNKILEAIPCDFLIMCAASYTFKIDIPRSITFFVPVLSAAFCIVERWLMRKYLHKERKRDKCTYATIIVGSPAGIHNTVQLLEHNKGIGYRPIAVCPITVSASEDNGSHEVIEAAQFEPTTRREQRLVVLPFDMDLPQIAKQMDTQTVLITDVVSRNSESLRALALAIEASGIELALATSTADLGGSTMRLRNDATMPVLTAQLPQYSAPIKLFKRALDIVLSLISLILLSPIMAWVAIRVKREDGGPVIFAQQRIGLYGQPFVMYKFRSMRVGAEGEKSQLAKDYGIEDHLMFKIKDDPRITKIGRFIRRTSLDELPQLFNVVKGEMSLVGPRPALPDEVSQYNLLYSSRLLAKPGITGLWQISGRSDLTSEQSEYADVSYIQNWSLTGDIAILLKTIIVVFRGTGSY
ncbi:exopolysaccharide biosynthesis polyprenyl glycosylphosphotransferase [Bombiscardovia apis]|uniref:Exopolysaccharide biosynthesis polyprenyl glycosylphosphotransferase n=1 Tax=Bombiscardovia apis TaxID=2932182 RepID=A0ABN6SE41_9BIFI|nr:sugar transferase [Bombiscardovia apis]BDR54296.1 exopolysaccharide biosynthesis polyprenyl glycosylphosphotransferase [Bombiscardovia apis]